MNKDNASIIILSKIGVITIMILATIGFLISIYLLCMRNTAGISFIAFIFAIIISAITYQEIE